MSWHWVRMTWLLCTSRWATLVHDNFFVRPARHARRRAGAPAKPGKCDLVERRTLAGHLGIHTCFSVCIGGGAGIRLASGSALHPEMWPAPGQQFWAEEQAFSVGSSWDRGTSIHARHMDLVTPSVPGQRMYCFQLDLAGAVPWPAGAVAS